MKAMIKKLTALSTALCLMFTSIVIPGMAKNITLAAEGAGDYSCDFTQLVTGGAETAYGTADDIIQLDEYTAASLTYEETYVSADGKVYLKSGTVCNGNGKYKDGSYISFTAPSDGTVNVTGADLAWFEGDTYKAYGGNLTIDASGGKTYHFGYRKGTTYINSLTFTADPLPTPNVDGYEEKTFGSVASMVKAPSNTEGLPLIVYLGGADSRGTDNTTQLVYARKFLDGFDNKAVLAAPQSEGEWGTAELDAYISGAKAQYNPSSVVVAAYGDDVKAAYAVSGTVDKIITISGGAELTPDQTEAVKTKKVWAFSAYTDANITEVRTTANALQLAGADLMYTEYPFEQEDMVKTVSAQTGLAEWITQTVDTNKTVDLVLFSGQSNMSGRGDYKEATECEPGTGYEFHPVTEPGVLTTVSEPFGKYENNDIIHDNSGQGVDRRGGDMVSSIMKAYYDNTGVPMVGVQASRGGQPTDYFNGSAVMAEMVGRYNEAAEYLESAGYTVRNKFLVWCQGEADADKNRSDTTYKNNTLSIFNSLKSGTGITDMFIVRTGHYNINYGVSSGQQPSAEALAKDAVYLRINQAQKAFAEENENVHYVASFYTNEALANMRDQYHYHQPTYNATGAMAGQNIAAVYDHNVEAIPVPEPDIETPEPTPTPTLPPAGAVNYNWDFATNQTATGGNNVPVLSGSASWDEAHQNIKFDANSKSESKLTVNLSPNLNGIITTEFDAYLTQLGQRYFGFEFVDNNANVYAKMAVDAYNNAGEFKIGGVDAAPVSEVTAAFNTVRVDGMEAEPTHFKVEIDTLKRTVTVTVKGRTEAVFTGSIPSGYSNTLASAALVYQSGSKTADRSVYFDNLSIIAYTPDKEMYVTGDASVSKKIGETVQKQYQISKTYVDDTETYEWSVSGVSGVTVDQNGLLTVPATAGTGTAVVKAKLTKSSTLEVGTEASLNVAINNFPAVKSYDIGGSTTIQLGGYTNFAVANVTDAEDNNISDKATLSDFVSSDTSVVTVDSSGKVTAKKQGTASVTFNLKINAANVTIPVTKTVRVGVYEVTSSDPSIDVSGMTTYSNTTYRMYKPDGSYERVTAANGKVANNTGKEVTVVPEYRFEFTNLNTTEDEHIKGYVKVGENSYTTQSGYGLVSGLNYNINEKGCLPTEDKAIKADLPYGMYDIVVYRQGGARADVYNDGIQIINNTTSSGSQNRPSSTGVMNAPQMLIADGSADITISNLSGSNERISSVTFAKVPDQYRKQMVWVAGDSTAADYYPVNADGDDLESQKIMMTGFGMQLDKFLSKDYAVANFGQPSATVKTWYNECFESVNYRMQSGDVLLIDFGINDAVSSSNKISVDEMEQYMEKMITAAKAKGVVPILLSPVYSNKYQSKSYFTYDPASQTNAMYEFASKMGVKYVDLNKYLQLYTQQAIDDTGDPAWITNNYHVSDNLHLTQYSALLTASLVAAAMDGMGYKTTDYAYTYNDLSSVNTDGYVKGEESGVTRVYSVDSAREFMGLPVNEGVYTYDEAQKTLTVRIDGVANADLFHAVYDTNGTLKSVKKQNITFTDGRAVVNIGLSDGDKVFLWDQDMRPFAEPYTYKASVVPTSTPAPTPTPTPSVPEEPKKVLYSEDFETYSVGDNGGWTSPAGTVAVKSDATSSIGKYLTLTSGKSGTARSGYKEITAIDKDFVLEADFKSTYYASNVSAFEVLDTKNSLYMNHGCYSNGKYAFKMNRPRGEKLYVINNPVSDSGMALSSYTQPAVVTNEISSDQWLHIKVVGDLAKKTATAYITSLDGKTEYYHGMTDMSSDITSFKCLALLAPSSGNDTCIDNILVYEARETDLAPKYHTVTIDDGITSFSQYVLDGESVVNIPDVSTYGEHFEGWKINNSGSVYSSAELAKAPITADSTVTAQVSSNYIEGIKSVAFNAFPAGNLLTMGADGDTYADNNISLTILGDNGTSLVTSPDSRVTDYKIDWEFIGFRTLDGVATGETGSSYCDSYGKIEITEKAQPSVLFKLKNTSANYYGIVKATVTYNGKTLEVSNPLLLLGDTNKDLNQLYPNAGYTSDYNKYEDGTVGYKTSENDLLTGGWRTSGSDSNKLELLSDATGKYLRITRAGTGNSSTAYNQVGDLTGQTVFEQDIRFNNDGSISYVGLSGSATITAPTSTAFSFELSNSKLAFNGTQIGTGANGKWYHAVICADNTTKKCWAKVYDYSENGVYDSNNLIGETATVDFAGDYQNGGYYRISPSKQTNASIDFNNITVRKAEIDESTISVVKSAETVNIPENGNSTAVFTVSAKTKDGSDAIGKADWAIDDELATGVKITADAADPHRATLTVDNTAGSGNLPIRVTIGGKSQVVTVKLIGTKDNVAFVTAPLGAKINAATTTYQYSAVVRDGNANDLSGRAITYELYDETNTNRISPAGISIDASGNLSVTSAAKPQTIAVRATSVDSSSNPISKYVKVSVYNLNFAFGSGTPANNYTAVNATTNYSESLGYGIEGTVTEGTSSLSGTGFNVKVKVEKGKVYNVSIKYSGSIVCERINSALSGFERTTDSLKNDSYQVAVFGDDVMDIAVTGEVESLSITEVVKTKAATPDWWTIGDSTIQQNGSWAYTIASSETNNLSKYPELDAVIDTFHNSGRAGRQHKSYYTEGLLNNLLCNMNPEDIVSISGMGTNDSSSTKDQFKEFNEIYTNAIIDMGGYVILGSYTPTGNYGATKGKVYDPDTMTFKGMRGDSYDIAIRELYEERKNDPKVIGFLDIGKMSDEKMTADVKAVYDAAIASGKSVAEARDAANARSEEMMGWWKDYNHYYNTFSNYILPDLTKAAAQIIKTVN